MSGTADRNAVSSATATDDADADKQARAMRAAALWSLGGGYALGLIGVFIYSVSPAVEGGWLYVFGISVLMAGAASFVGGGLGFLFGIPRTFQLQPSDPKQLLSYTPSTNLEQISDWLTKIIVGVSLTQFTAIRVELARVATLAAAGLGGGSANQVYASAVLSFSAVLGFLIGYLWTRFYLPEALRASDLAALGNLGRTVVRMKQKVESMQKQADHDGEAQSLAAKQLAPENDTPSVNEAELASCFDRASVNARRAIFTQAATHRSTWQRAGDKARMELAIPIFRALIACDREKRFHRNHGELGYALKDRTPPDTEGALVELTEAIRIRGAEPGWRYYEANRAICRILLDPAKDKGPSGPQLKAQILEDLGAAFTAPSAARWLRGDSVVQAWLSRNGLTEADVTKQKPATP